MGERLSLIFLLFTTMWGRFSILTRKTENQRVRYLPPPWSHDSSGSKMPLIVPKCQTASITLSLEKQVLLLDNDPGGGVEVKTPVARQPACYAYVHTPPPHTHIPHRYVTMHRLTPFTVMIIYSLQKLLQSSIPSFRPAISSWDHPSTPWEPPTAPRPTIHWNCQAQLFPPQAAHQSCST